MKKQILTIAIAAIALCTATTTFAKDSKKSDKATTSECCAPQGNEMKAPRPACPFEGIQLTDAQKAKLAEIKAPGQQQMEARRDAKAERRLNRDSIAKADRSNYLTNVKAVLTPEQYVQFLENTFVNQPNQPAPGRNGGMRGGDRPMDRGPRMQ